MKMSFLWAVAALLIGAAEIPKMPRMPSMKEGVWLIRNQTVQHPSEEKAEGAGEVCQKADWNNGPIKVQTPKGKCKYAVESGATSQKYEVACEVSGVQIKVTETRELVDENNGRTVVDITSDPPTNGATGTTLVSEATYVSACPADVKPGSQMMPDGTFAQKSGK
jgi:Flp pilus assembly protein TadG